jgi:hypothetical protein
MSIVATTILETAIKPFEGQKCCATLSRFYDFLTFCEAGRELQRQVFSRCIA